MEGNSVKFELTKEVLDSVKDIDGFPIGEDENIIALSDPPYYTMCPNPFIKDYIEKHGKPYDQEKDDYHREPFASDVSEGKNDPIYNAHTYHTKVPHKAVMRYILHYTDPGDIVFDGFCGTGMTGIAAQSCENPKTKFKQLIEKEMPYIKWGARGSILSELSPSATFISYNLTNSVNLKDFKKEANKIIKNVEKEIGWIYETSHHTNDKSNYEASLVSNFLSVKGLINYTVWSDIFICPECTSEFVFWDVALKKNPLKIKKIFNCPHCDKELSKNMLERSYEVIYDQNFKKSMKIIKQKPVLINYMLFGSKHKRGKLYEKVPDKTDLDLLDKINQITIPYWYPSDRMPNGDESRRNDDAGITHVHHFYTKRNLIALSTLYNKILESKYRRQLLFVFQSFCATLSSKLSRYNLGRRGNGPLSGTLYISSLNAEANVIEHFKTKLNYISRALQNECYPCITSCSSSTNLENIPSNSVDYIFTDPPFGGNLMYSELNFLWESWLKVFTNSKKEAIVNDVQKKGLYEYQLLMEDCFKEFFRVLKPGRWMTVEFHNSQNKVWIAIQEALMRARFVVADVRTLDKKQGTFKQLTTTSAVKQDLVISSYKPNEGFEDSLQLIIGTEDGVWAFIRQHLKHLPIYVEENGVAEVINERQNYLLYDRMVAFHIQRGITVPISASEFYAGLKERFPQRDGMYFIIDQVAEYDRKRMKAQKIEQTYLTVHDEKSAIHWLRRELENRPQTYQEIQPKFLQNLYKAKHEDLPELRDILEQNFIQDDEERWHVPDPTKDRDLEKLRLRALLSEFRDYLITRGKIRIFRSEAVRAGFNESWQQGDYESIINVAEKLPTEVLQEDPTLLMYYDNALMRIQD